MPDSQTALRNANPRKRADFASLVDEARRSLDAQIATAPHLFRPAKRRAFGATTAAASLAGVVFAVVFLAIGSRGDGDASAAFERAAAASAASAEQSGTAIVRITRGGELWAGTTVRWNGDDLSVASDFPRRPGEVPSELLLVNGLMFGRDERSGAWVVLGKPESIDPASGTTPDEYLAAVRRDVGGETLRRITAAMSDLTAAQRGDGSTAYRGAVPARVVARETGFKGGREIRVLPFGHVAHDEAARGESPLAVVVTVAPEGVVSELRATWGSWRYSVRYRGLGATPALVAPPDARPLRERLRGANRGA